MICNACELCKTRKQIVLGEGPLDSGLMLVGEGPGEEEDAVGRPFIGKAGRELNDQYLLRFARVLRHEWYVTNVVKCRPPGNRDPRPEEISACSRHLLAEMVQAKARVIGAMGKFATSFFLGRDADMEMLHGIPQRGMNDVIIVPLYHPAAGLHDPSKMVYIQRDFEMLGRVVRGEVVPEDWRDEYPETQYVTRGNVRQEDMTLDLISVDTETYVDGSLFSTQWSGIPGRAVFIPFERFGIRARMRTALLVMHNALFDLPLLRHWCEGVDSKIMDTMVMAYVLQDEPQGLKTLAYRHCGMAMSTFDELVSPVQQQKSRAYLTQVAAHSWPEPQQILVWDGDTPRLKKPWAISRKAASILSAWQKDNSVDMYARWSQIPEEEGRGAAERRYGAMPRAGIEHVHESKARHYACRDADATLRVFSKLWPRVKTHGLEPAFWIDMGIVDMVVDMMANGMPTKPERFLALASEFGMHAEEAESEIAKLVGHYVNPASSKQVAELLFKTLRLRSRKKNKRTGDDSTDQKYLEQMKGDHAVVGKILEWRKAKKLQTTYAEALPRLVDSAGRIHPRIKTTRTSTGRLATASPNLQNIPVRSKDGRAIRNCFIAPDGRTFLSLDYCLPPDTEIITEQGPMQIGDAYPGLGVLSSDGHTVRFNKVSRTARVYATSVTRITTDCGEVACSRDHKWMLRNGDMIKAEDLRIGDRLCQVKDGYSGRYPTWWIHSHFNYVKKHIASARYRYGDAPDGFEADHSDGDVSNWKVGNIEYKRILENRAQGGQRYWDGVKRGLRSDEHRLIGLRAGLKKRRSYLGEGNPRYGKRMGEIRVCPVCGTHKYRPPSQKSAFCSRKCYLESCKTNHQVTNISSEAWVGELVHITVDNDHTFVLTNGMVSGNSQIELRTLAHESRDPVMMEAYWNDEDIHSKTASLVFGIPVADLHPYNHRRPAKTCNFAVVYGITPEGLQDSLAREGADQSLWNLEKCTEFIAEWFKIYKGVKEYMQRQEEHARQHGYVKDMFGRIRHIPGVCSTIKSVVSGAIREAGNMPIQAGAQEIMKIAMADLTPVYRRWKAEGRVVRPIMQIHDDLLWEVEEGMVAEVYHVCKIMMENAVQLRVPVKADGKVGPIWGQMKEVAEHEM